MRGLSGGCCGFPETEVARIKSSLIKFPKPIAMYEGNDCECFLHSLTAVCCELHKNVKSALSENYVPFNTSVSTASVCI
jgi:hypothetical protein